MNESKAVKVIRTLTPNERRSLVDFIRSPYFNQSDNLALLCQCIVNGVNNAVELLDTPTILQSFNKQRASKVERGYLNVLISKLNKKLDTFIAVESLKYKERLTAILALEFVNDRNLFKEFEKDGRRVEKLLKKSALETDLYHDLYRFYRLEASQKRQELSTLNIIFTSDFDQKNNFETYQYLRLLRRVLSEVVSEISYSDVSATQHEVEKVKANITNGYLADNPLVNLYYLGFQMFIMDNADERYQAFKQSVYQFERNISKREMHDLVQLGITFCMDQVMEGRGDNDYYNECSELNHFLLDKKILDYNTYFNRVTFNHMILAFCNNREFDHARIVLKEYRDRLSPNNREDTINFNLGLISYRTDNHADAITYFNKIVGRLGVFSEFNMRLIKISIYYQQGEFELLDAQLKSTQNYVYRKSTISTQYREGVLNLVKYFQRLLKVNKVEHLLALKKEVTANNKMINKAWILSLIDDKLKQKI